MRTTDLFNFNRSSKRLNESLQKTFGTRINFESFDTPKLEDARNKLRTQIHTARNQSGFNETIENEALTKAQFMHDAIVAELMDRQEHIVDTTVEEAADFDKDEVVKILSRFESDLNEIGGYADLDYNKIMSTLAQEGAEAAVEEVSYSIGDKDGGEVRGVEPYLEDLVDNLDYALNGSDDEGGDTDDAYALASAGHGSDEDYGDFPESMEERVRDPEDWDEGNTEPPNNFAIYINGKKWKVFKGRGQYADDAREMAHYQQLKDMCARKSEATGKKWSVSITGENPTESLEVESAPPTAKGERMVKHIKKGYANDGKLTDKEKSIAYATAWKQHNKGESIQTELSTNTLKSYQDKAGKDIVNTMTSGDHMTTDKSAKKVMNRMRGSEKADNKIWKRNESINTGDDMRNLREGEIQQASAIVTAKTMVDRVGRWIEELSGMENETLLQLGDSIRDEMGQEQAKAFIEAVAPAIQQALENLKTTRDTLSTGVRSLASGEAPADMLGAEPAMGDEGGMDMAEPDMMNEPEMGAEEDPFAAAEPGAGGMETSGREQRESIDRQSRLMKILAG
jgi:hypothetical protein